MVDDTKCVDMLFDRFSECTLIIECQIREIYIKAVNSKKLLIEQLNFLESSFDMFSGNANHLLAF